jgi:hypothetical protein
VSTSSGQITLILHLPYLRFHCLYRNNTGGAAGVKDLTGNPLAASYTSSFTTAATTSQPVTIQMNSKTGAVATIHPTVHRLEHWF